MEGRGKEQHWCPAQASEEGSTGSIDWSATTPRDTLVVLLTRHPQSSAHARLSPRMLAPSTHASKREAPDAKAVSSNCLNLASKESYSEGAGPEESLKINSAGIWYSLP